MWGFVVFCFRPLSLNRCCFLLTLQRCGHPQPPTRTKKRFCWNFLFDKNTIKGYFRVIMAKNISVMAFFVIKKLFYRIFLLKKNYLKEVFFHQKKNFQSPKFMLSPLQQVIQKIKLPCSRWIRKSKKRKKCPPEEVIPALTSKGKEYNLDDRNVRLYIFSILIGAVAIEYHIREDKEAFYGDKDGTGNQLPHFNSGSPPKKLSNHHYWEKWSKLRNIRYPPKVTPFL